MNIKNLIDTSNQHSQARWFNLETNKESKHVDIYLYGVIGGYNVNLQQFLQDLSAAGEVDTITVYLNSVGGYFGDGLPIFNTLKQHKAHVTVKVMGYALSMASVIMLAGDVVEAAENALIMIHRAYNSEWGNADDLTKAAEILLKHEAAIIPEYARRMNLSDKAVFELLKAETWYTASEAKQAGLIDRITGEAVLDKAAAKLDGEVVNYALSNYRNVPANLRHYLNYIPRNISPVENITSDGEFVSKRKFELLQDDYGFLKQRYDDFKSKRQGAENSEVEELKIKLDAMQQRLENTERIIAKQPQPGTVPPLVTGPAGHHNSRGWFDR